MCLLTAVVVACGGGSGGEPSPDRPPPATPAPTSAPTPALSPRPPGPTPDVVGRWVSVGMEGGRVNEIAVDPDRPEIMYAATSAGIFRSADAGQSWEWASEGIRDPRGFLPRDGARRIAVDPNDPTVLYAATSSGVFKSVDEAATWRAASTGMQFDDGSGRSIGDLAIDPWSPGTIYATAQHLYRTTDGAESWQRIDNGGSPVFGFRVGVHPYEPDRILLAASGIVFSHDDGETWEARNEGPFLSAQFNEFVFDPTDVNRVFAPGDRGVMRSDDQGESWRHASRGLPHDGVFPVLTWSFAQEAGNALRVYAGTSSGLFTRRVGTLVDWDEVPFIDDVAFDLLSTSHGLYAGTTTHGVQWRPSPGAEWRDANVGLDAPPILRLIGTSSQDVYAILDGGSVRRSSDFGRTWMSVASLEEVDVIEIAVHPLDPSIVAAIAVSGEFFHSMDGGATFAPRIPLQLGGGFPTARISFDRDDPDRLFVAMGRVFRTSDGGETWEALVIPNPSSFGCGFFGIVVSPVDPELVFALNGIHGVARSLDGGDTFSPVGCGISGGFASGSAIVADPEDPLLAYASTLGGFMRTRDGGETWEETFGGVADIAIDPQDRSHLYVTARSGVFESQDFGESWTPLAAQPIGYPDRGLVVDPTYGDALLVGSPTRGIERLIRNQ